MDETQMIRHRNLFFGAVLVLVTSFSCCEFSTEGRSTGDEYSIETAEPVAGVEVEVRVVKTVRSGSPIELTVSISNNGTFGGRYGVLQGFMDCRLLIRDGDGRILQTTDKGFRVFGKGRNPEETQVVTLVPGHSRTMTCDLNEHFRFESRYEDYRLSLKSHLEDPTNPDVVFPILVENLSFRID